MYYIEWKDDDDDDDEKKINNQHTCFLSLHYHFTKSHWLHNYALKKEKKSHRSKKRINK